MEDIAIKFFVYAVMALVLGCCLYLATISFLSRNSFTSAFHDGELKPCPNTPNCVSSVAAAQSQAFVEPLAISDGYLMSWQRARAAIDALGGEIVSEQSNYLHARFTSRVFRFIDDVELLVDTRRGVIQIRSASRVGRSDFGVNRKRVERLRKLYTGKK